MGRRRGANRAGAMRLWLASLAFGVCLLTFVAVASARPVSSGGSGAGATPDSTATLLSASPADAATGQDVTLTAMVTDTANPGATPTGIVTFQDGGIPITCQSGNPNLDSSGTASCQTQFGTTGVHTLTAVYTPSDPTAFSASSDAQPENVGDPTSTSLTASPSDAATGQSVTLSATVTDTANSAAPPAGTVTFDDVGSPIASCQNINLDNSGTASCQATFTSAGAHSLTAIYTPSDPTAFAGSTSGSQTENVGDPTSTALTASPSPATATQQVTLTATVTDTLNGTNVQTGNVEFDNNGNPIPQCQSIAVGQSGTATCPTQFTPGTESLTATYTPSDPSTLASSASAPTTLVVARDSTTITVTASPDSPAVGQAVTYTATVTPGLSGSAEPSGTVILNPGDGAIGACTQQPLTAGPSSSTATCTVTYPSTGQRSITASYGGDANFVGSTTNQPLTVTVGGAASTTTLKITPSSPAPVTNQTLTLGATVSGSQGTATGTVAFVEGTTSLCQAQLTSGAATCKTSFGRGTHKISAMYTPDQGSNYATSQGAATVTVNPDTPTVHLTASTTKPQTGRAVTYTVNVAPTFSGSVLPTGRIVFKAGSATVGSCPGALSRSWLSSVATCMVTYRTAGSHTITASYGGDQNFGGASNSATITVVLPPVAATTGGASHIKPTGARFSGIILTRGESVFWQFRYGVFYPYVKATVLRSIGAGHGAAPVSITVAGLRPATSYHVELVVYPNGGTRRFGHVESFTTKPLGRVMLPFGRLRAITRSVSMPVRCLSRAPCTGQISMTTHAAGAKATRTLVCAQPSYRVPAGHTRDIAARVSPSCAALARKHGNRLSVVVRSLPVSHQYPTVKTVTLLLR